MAGNSMFIRIAANVEELKKNLADGTATINVTSAAMMKLASGLDGNKLIQHAQNIVGAVNEIGGATKLTEGEKARLNVTLEKAIDKYRVLGQEAPAAMVRLAEETRHTQSATELFQERWASLAAAAGTAWLAVQRLVTEVKGWLTEASKQEDATARLTAALIAQGTYTPTLKQQYTDLADALQKTTIHADELTFEMMALLVQVGHVMPEQMAGALEAAMNLAAGMRISLPEATTLLAKALGTGGESLGRLKGLLGDTTIAGKDTESVLRAINEKFGGQAAAQAETYAGKVAILRNRYEELKERAGALLASALVPLIDRFNALDDSTQDVILVAGLLAGVLVPLAAAIAGIGAAVVLLLPVLTAAWPAALATLTALMGPASLIVAALVGIVVVWKKWDAISGIVQGVYTAVKTWLVDRFQNVMATIKGYIDTVINWWRSMLSVVGGAVTLGVTGGTPPPGRADGGPVTGGSPYMVGERGPELFVPRSSGTIVPNGAGGMSIVVHVDARESFYDTPAGVRRLGDKVGAAVLATLRSRGAVAG